MSQSLDSPDALSDLIHAMCDRPLTADEMQWLDQRLRVDADARWLYLTTATLSAGLEWLHDAAASVRSGSMPLSSLAVAVDSGTLPVAAAHTTISPRGSSQQKPATKQPHIQKLQWIVAASLIGVILVWGLSNRGHRDLAQRNPSNAPETAKARLTALDNCRWKSPAVANQLNALLGAGQHELISGIAELTLESGVRTAVTGPATFELVANNRVRLSSGQLSAVVPSKAKGFAVETPHAIVVDLGTEFRVTTSAHHPTEVAVTVGVVDVMLRNSSASALRLTAGQRLQITEHGFVGQGKLAAVQPNAQQSDLPIVLADDALSPYSQHVLAATKPIAYWSMAITESTATRDLVAGLSLDSFQPAQIRIPGPQPMDGFANFTETNQAVDVRDDSAITCRRLAELRVGTQYSVQMWFQLADDGATRAMQYLLGRGNGWEPTDARDAVAVAGSDMPEADRGRLVFFAADGAAPNVGKTSVVANQWHHLLLVRNERGVEIYLNGQSEIATDFAWQGGIGGQLTWGSRSDLPEAWGLQGRIDEAALWNRALSAEEATSLFQLATQPQSEKE